MALRPTLGIPLAVFVAVSLGALAGQAWAQVETAAGAAYVGHEQCQTCHPDQLAKFAETRMGKIFLRGPRDELEKWACESCHGPGSEHVKNPTDPKTILRFGKQSPAAVEAQNRACLQCHEKGMQTYWTGSPHEARGLACMNCHKVMEKTSDRSQLVSEEEKTPFYARRAESEVCFQCHLQRRAQLLRSSHMPLWEGKMTCTDCHKCTARCKPSSLASVTGGSI